MWCFIYFVYIDTPDFLIYINYKRKSSMQMKLFVVLKGQFMAVFIVSLQV